MFDDHQPMIARHAGTPQGFADVVLFVMATQNRHFHRVGTVIDDIHDVGIDNAKYLTSHQKRGIHYAIQHAERYVVLLADTRISNSAKIATLLEIPHIGIVKAGFIVQLCCGEMGCLDRHNLATLGLDPKAFARVPTRTEALSMRIQTYINTCDALGSSAQLYDGWCHLIAAKYPNNFENADNVSYAHVAWCNVPL